MATQKTDFLRFNAYSMKELITRKMSEDSKFTDQIYEGSNLAILIDLVAYMYQVLVYQLNNAASESMFSDTQIYENINRLVKFIGYHPQGYIPSQLTMYIYPEELGDNVTIPMFSRFDTGLVDTNGKKIYFSTIESYSTTANEKSTLVLYNGEWKMHSTVFTATGVDNETFVLNGVKSDSDEKEYVADTHFKIVVQNADTNKFSSLDKWKYDRENIFIKQSGSLDSAEEYSFAKLYNEEDTIFNAYLNEDKTYEIRFGNGISGKKLNKNDKVYVFYLETNGPDGQIDPTSINIDNRFEHNSNMFGMNQEMYNEIFKTSISDGTTYEVYSNINSITPGQSEQSVEAIRETAPDWFKIGNRLVSKRDHEYYIKGIYTDVVDVKCLNNWEYLNTFYKWLYMCGMNPNGYISEEYRSVKLNGGHTYIDQFRIESQGYKFVDPADACNLYLVMELQDNSIIESRNAEIDQKLQNIKTLTTELYAVTPVHVQFQICAADYGVETYRIARGLQYGDSYIEITIDDNLMYVASTIQYKVADIIFDFFKKNNRKIGETIDFNQIQQSIYGINGVQRIRTVFVPIAGTQLAEKTINGLSFSSYSDTELIQRGEDLDISTSARTLEDFQFPVLGHTKESLVSKIKVIKKQLSNSNPIKF